MSVDRPADKIAKIVALASGDGPEAQSAHAKALEMVGELDLEMLTTLAGQRAALLRDLRIECRRLIGAKERANKRTTGDLVSRSMLLFRHYERIDALLAVVALLQGKVPPEPGDDFLTRLLGDRYREDHDKWRDRVD